MEGQVPWAQMAATELHVELYDWFGQMRSPLLLLPALLLIISGEEAPAVSAYAFVSVAVSWLLHAKQLAQLLRLRKKMQTYGGIYPTGSLIDCGLAHNRALNGLGVLLGVNAIVALILHPVVVKSSAALVLDLACLFLELWEFAAAASRILINVKKLETEFTAAFLGIYIRAVKPVAGATCGCANAQYDVVDRNAFVLSQHQPQLDAEVILMGED
jgi:hypothetical protein